jgi:hypothetical protein
VIRGIDHLVIACADPDAAARDLTDAVGLAVTGGGRHVGRGTFNRIAWLADGSYLEQPVGAAAVRALDEHGGGLATYALREDDVGGAAAALSALGSFGAASHGSRTTPDGETVEWWTTFPTAPLGTDATPFLIQHAYTGSEWSPSALEARGAFQHPIGSPVGLVRLDIASADPPSMAAMIHQDLGIDFWAVADLAVAEVGPHIIRLVPRREMPVPAVVTLAAMVDAPRTADLLGLRFDVEQAELPVATSGRG